MSASEPSIPARLSDLSPRHKSIIFGTMLGAIFMSTLDVTIVATALPDIVSALGGFQEYTFVATAYLIGTVVAIPVIGKLTDIHGRKWYYIASIVVFVTGSALCGFSRNMTELIVFRGIQGLGAGGMIANAFTIIGDLYPPSERGKYQSYISGIFGLSSIIGPLAGGFLTDYLSWEWIFFINIPIGVIVILLFLRYLPLIRPDEDRKGIDVPGIVLVVLAIVPLLVALSWGGDTYPWLSPQILGMLGFALLMIALLVLVERNAARPIIPLYLYRNGVIAISVAATFLLGVAMYAGIIFVPLWFQGVQGESATASGSYLTPMMLGLVAGAFLSGQGLTRAGGHYKWQGIAGIIVLAGGMWWLSRLEVDTKYLTSVASMVIAGFGLGITFPLYSTAIQNVVSRREMGAAISAVPFWRFIGGAFGLAILGTVLTNTFVTDFLANIPAQVHALVPNAQLTALATNPHGLVSGQGQAQLKQLLATYVPNPDQAFQQVILALRQALNAAIVRVIFIGFIASVVALAVHVFIKEIPLKRTHSD